MRYFCMQNEYNSLYLQAYIVNLIYAIDEKHYK